MTDRYCGDRLNYLLGGMGMMEALQKAKEGEIVRLGSQHEPISKEDMALIERAEEDGILRFHRYENDLSGKTIWIDVEKRI